MKVFIKKVSFTVSFFIGYVIFSLSIIGCQPSTSTPEAPPIYPHFDLSSAAKELLPDVNCSFDSENLNCNELNEIEGEKNDSWEQRNLEYQIVQINKRIAALNFVHDELTEAQKSQWSPSSTGTLLSLILEVSNQTTTSSIIKAHLVGSLEKEKLFQTKIGYNCFGKFGFNNLDNSFHEIFEFPKKIEEDKKKSSTASNHKRVKTSDPDHDIKIDYNFHEEGRQFVVHIGTDRELNLKDDEMQTFSVGMDGEFHLNLSEPNVANITCPLSTALDSNPKKIVDRFIERARLNCINSSIIPSEDNGKLKGISHGQVEANYGDDDVNESIFNLSLDRLLFIHGKVTTNKLKYAFNVATDRGKISFRLFNLKTKKIVAEAKTTNRSNNIRLLYKNNGYGALIDCHRPKKTTKVKPAATASGSSQ